MPNENQDAMTRPVAAQPIPESARVPNNLQHFKYDHLPEHLQAHSKPFCDLAQHVADTYKDGAEKSACLRKLLEAKDCAVRASLESKADDAAG